MHKVTYEEFHFEVHCILSMECILMKATFEDENISKTVSTIMYVLAVEFDRLMKNCI